MTEDKILWTARYAEGDLDEAENLVYERVLAQDQELKEHLLDYLAAQGSLQLLFADDKERQTLMSTLATLNEQHFAGVEDKGQDRIKQLKTVQLGAYLRWVAGVAAVLVLGILIWAPWKTSLYEQFSSVSQMNVAERGGEQTALDKAASLFNDKKYREAKLALAQINGTDPQNTMVAYYYALSLMETNEIAKARLILEELFKGESVYKYDAAYTMAMSYLKEDKKTDTKFWLEKIPEGSVQFEKAQKLLDKL